MMSNLTSCIPRFVTSISQSCLIVSIALFVQAQSTYAQVPLVTQNIENLIKGADQHLSAPHKLKGDKCARTYLQSLDRDQTVTFKDLVIFNDALKQFKGSRYTQTRVLDN